jgi:hypothetical protein
MKGGGSVREGRGEMDKGNFRRAWIAIIRGDIENAE